MAVEKADLVWQLYECTRHPLPGVARSPLRLRCGSPLFRTARHLLPPQLCSVPPRSLVLTARRLRHYFESVLEALQGRWQALQGGFEEAAAAMPSAGVRQQRSSRERT